MSTALVSLVDGIPCTTSLKVAEVFGKKHHNVLRDIENIKAQVSESFSQLNFESANYTDAQGKTRIMYLLTRDGLTLLVMGYTGKEAMKFKLAYIEAFNAMEKQLEALRSMPDPCLSVEDRRPLSNLIGQWAGKAKMSFPDCWRELHSVFGISTVSELPASQLPAALAWVQAKIDALEARRAPELPAPESTLAFPMELAVYGATGKGQPVNLWEELKDAERILKNCSAGIALACRSGSLSHMTPEKWLFHKILTTSADHAAASVMMAMQAVRTCLSVKSEVDFFTI